MSLLKYAVPAALLIIPFSQNLLSPSSCLSESFYGTYRSGWNTTQSVFLSDAACLASVTTTNLMEQTYVAEVTRPLEGRRLVWIEKVAVDASLFSSEKQSLDDFFERLGRVWIQHRQNEQQLVLSSEQLYSYEVLYQTPDALLVSVPHTEAYNVEPILPRFWKSTILPPSPVKHYPVPPEAVDPVRDTLQNLRFNPTVAGIVHNISIPQMKNDIRFLTGEDGKSGIVSRHSFTTGALTAATWIKDQIEETGAKCELRQFLVGFAPNVICRYESVVPSNATIIIGGHYDSRGSFGSMRAPGGNDDGSGTTAVLAIARTIKRKGVKFHTNVELCTFAGEEQGRLGSIGYARELRAAGANITLMIQADMLAYRAPEEPLQIGLPETISTPEATQLVANISAIYSPELHVGYTAACCSDHQSFLEHGFPATQVFERAGPLIDPMYHNSGDLSDRPDYSFEQLYGIAKVQFATLLHTAGFEQ